MVHDGNVDHSADTEQWVHLKAEMAQDAFDAFVSWCTSDQLCRLGGEDGDVRSAWHRLLRQADAGEFPHPDASSTRLRSYDLIESVYECAFGPAWADLAGFLDALHTGASTPALPCREGSRRGSRTPVACTR
jgi:hypothetical protein